MSLFKARDWWSTVVGNKEEFDQGCLCVANVDNSSSGQDKIIVGSYMGFLRIYNPHPAKPGDPVQAEELLLETQLREPILQVEVGKFVSYVIQTTKDHTACVTMSWQRVANQSWVHKNILKMSQSKCNCVALPNRY